MFKVCLFVFIIFCYSYFINGFFIQNSISNLIRNKTILNSVIVGTNKNYLQDYIFSSSISKDTIYIPIALFYFYALNLTNENKLTYLCEDNKVIKRYINMFFLILNVFLIKDIENAS